MQNELYEEYHKSRHIQKRIIGIKNFTYRYILEMLVKYLNKPSKVLDIGCGTGALDFFLAKRGHDITGVDISRNAINVANLNSQRFGLHKRIKFLVSKFPENRIIGKFDFIICSEVIEHLNNDKIALNKIFNLLNPHGIALISVPSSSSPLFNVGLTKKHDKTVGHLRRYDKHTLIKLLTKVNFEVLESFRNQSLFREFLFTNPIFSFVIRVANRFGVISDIFTFIDRALILFGESDLMMIVKKKC